MQGGGLLSILEIIKSLWPGVFQKPELRVPGDAGEIGSAQKLRLWSREARPRSSPSSTSFWLNELGQAPGLQFLHLQKSHRVGVRSQSDSKAARTEYKLGICNKMPDKL